MSRKRGREVPVLATDPNSRGGRRAVRFEIPSGQRVAKRRLRRSSHSAAKRRKSVKSARGIRRKVPRGQRQYMTVHKMVRAHSRRGHLRRVKCK